MQAVPLGFFLFLAEFAAGVLVVTALLDWDGDVSAGYLFLNGVFALLALGAGLWLRLILPAERLLDAPPGQPWLDLEVGAWCVVVALGAIQLFCVKTERRAAGRASGAGAGLAGVGALAVSAGAYGGAATPVLFAALAVGALAQGAVWSGMMLGHWYLVTPLLKPRPLLRLIAGLTAALGLLTALTVVTAFAGREIAADPALGRLMWLRAGVGLLLPLVLMWPIWRTARVRSMMSATGLLYVALGFVLAGQIIARALYFVGGVAT